MTLRIEKSWAMPSAQTFSIRPIGALVSEYLKDSEYSVDPFANGSRRATVTNDIDPQFDTDYHMDALDFLRGLPDGCADLVLYDPPYSARQVSECYKKMGMTVNMQTTQASYWTNQKREISRIVRSGGVVITCAWNSGGIGKKFGFEQERILLVAHGGWHNDTIVTVERKVR